MAAAPRTMFEKIWNRHVIAEEEGEVLLYVDRALHPRGLVARVRAARCREAARWRGRSRSSRHADHYVPTAAATAESTGIAVPEIRNMVKLLQANAAKHGVTLFGIDDPRQGILHIVPPEQGITQPGLLIVGADSHTSTHGAFGSLAFGVGASEVMHVMATQQLWQRKPATLRISVDGKLGFRRIREGRDPGHHCEDRRLRRRRARHRVRRHGHRRDSPWKAA